MRGMGRGSGLLTLGKGVCGHRRPEETKQQEGLGQLRHSGQVVAQYQHGIREDSDGLCRTRGTGAERFGAPWARRCARQTLLTAAVGAQVCQARPFVGRYCLLQIPRSFVNTVTKWWADAPIWARACWASCRPGPRVQPIPHSHSPAARPPPLTPKRHRDEQHSSFQQRAREHLRRLAHGLERVRLLAPRLAPSCPRVRGSASCCPGS